MTTSMYVLRELEDAIYDCEQGCQTDDCNDDAVHALDEAVAFYSGSLEGADGSGEGVLMYSLADKRSANFKTSGAKGNALEGTAKANLDIIREFKFMKAKLQQKDCDAARVHRERIGELIFVPFIQGTIRYAYLTATDPDSSAKSEAEGATFAASVVPMVHACSEEDAKIIYEKMMPGVPNTMEDFQAVKGAFERNYGCMKITCQDVGGVWDDASEQYFDGAAPCGSGSTSTVNVGLAVGLSVGLAAALALLIGYCVCCRKKSSQVEFKSDNPVA